METAWQTCTDLNAMLDELSNASGRKLRLFAAACLRRIERLIPPDERRARFLEIIEKWADKEISERTLREARAEARTMAGGDEVMDAVTSATSTTDWGAAIGTVEYAARAVAWTTAESDIDAAIRAENVAQCDLLREIFGNPFRPLPPRPEAIAPLAQDIYAGNWRLMPLLGEWLQEHGFWEIGEHCLDPRTHHYKGCWVVDWVLGKQ